MLTLQKIKNKIDDGSIKIEPFDVTQLNANSYDLCLSNLISYYKDGTVIDPKVNQGMDLITECLPTPDKKGFLLSPHIGFYLVSTVESTYTPDTIPVIWAKSSIARLGISLTLGGGFGDLGYKGRWTLALQVTRPTYIYAGMAVAQVAFFEPNGDIEQLYGDLSGNYQSEDLSDITTVPVPHKLYKNALFNPIK